MHRPVIAVDIDDVIVPHFGELAHFASETFGIHLTAHEMFYAGTVKTIVERTGLDKETIMKRIDDFLMTDEFYIDPVPGSKKVLPALAQYYDLVIVTSRPQPMKDPTTHWLEAHFPKLFSHIRVVGHERWGLGVAPKGDIFRELGVSILIDDHPSHCNDAVALGIRALLFGEYEWTSANEVSREVEHVRNWDEVADALLTPNRP